MKRYLITSALPYASGITHLGNVVGSTLPADIYARFCRLHGRETLSISGSDEHGVAITIAAEKAGVTPQEIIDKYHTANKLALEKLGIHFDLYGRTSSPLHYSTAQEFFTVWLEKGLLTKREDDQFYDSDAEMFLPDRYVEGTCPNCGYDKARGDQCDNCGAYYNQLDLKNPKSLISGKMPVVRKTQHWYFHLEKFQEWTEAYIEGHAAEWKDNVIQQSRSWLKQGLAERAATRDMKWGIPVPAEGAEGKVLYVWFEAVLGYISITKQWSLDVGREEDWKKWWRDADTNYTAFLGKDNIVFHAIIFPILLRTMEQDGYILPTNVPANEFLNLEGQKFSKSRGWAIDLLQYQEMFPEEQHVDILRYVLTMNMPETKDSDFTWRDYQARTNNELAAILGNYVNRVMQFAYKNFDGKVPAYDNAKPVTEHEEALQAAVANGVKLIAEQMDVFRFRDAATEAMNVARAANKYFNDKAPWKSIKDNVDDCARTINVCIQTANTLATLFAPLLPHTAQKIQSMVGSAVNVGEPNTTCLYDDAWTAAGNHTIAAGTQLGESVILFTKIEDDTLAKGMSMLGSPEKTEGEVEKPAEDLIDIGEFAKVKLRTGIVIAAEAVPKSEKLLKLQVDLGTEQRQVLAGIAKHYSPEDLIGKTVVVVANLKPAKLMGMESQGMILAASNAAGELALVSPLSTTIGGGAEVR